MLRSGAGDYGRWRETDKWAESLETASVWVAGVLTVWSLCETGWQRVSGRVMVREAMMVL